MTRADPTANLPPVRVEPDARRRIRRALAVFETDEIAAGLSSAGSTCFFLTNTRSLSEADAVELNTRIGRMLFDLAARLDAPIDMVSRSDSTLRGHVIAEVRALDAVRRQATGRGFDGVLLVPAYVEAGRFTAGNVHWARVGTDVLPVSETEFARDATFGYAASDLRDFVAEKSGGAVQPGDVLSITHDDIRLGGPRRVAELLAGVTGGGFVVVNAVEYADLDVVVLGLLEAAAAGRSFLYRSGPSFVQSLAGLDPRDPLQASDIWPAGHPGGHGLVVVGSHVGLTSRQVAVARRYGGLTEVELDVAAIADAGRRDAHLAEATRHGDLATGVDRHHRGGPRGPCRPARLGRGQGRHHLARCGRPRPRHPEGQGPRPAAPRHGVGLPPDRRRPRGCRHALCRVRRQRRRRDHPGVGRQPLPGESLMPARGTD